MEDFVQNLIAQGPLGIVAAAVVYLVITIQRVNTKKDRDSTADEFDKRISLLENETKRIKDLDLETKLAQIQTDLQWIKENLKK